MTTCPRIAVHPVGAGAPEATVHVGTDGGTSARAPQALVDVSTLVLGAAVVTLRAFAFMSARQIHA